MLQDRGRVIFLQLFPVYQDNKRRRPPDAVGKLFERMWTDNELVRALDRLSEIVES